MINIFIKMPTKAHQQSQTRTLVKYLQLSLPILMPLVIFLITFFAIKYLNKFTVVAATGIFIFLYLVIFIAALIFFRKIKILLITLVTIELSLLFVFFFYNYCLIATKKIEFMFNRQSLENIITQGTVPNIKLLCIDNFSDEDNKSVYFITNGSQGGFISSASSEGFLNTTLDIEAINDNDLKFFKFKPNSDPFGQFDYFKLDNNWYYFTEADENWGGSVITPSSKCSYKMPL